LKGEPCDLPGKHIGKLKRRTLKKRGFRSDHAANEGRDTGAMMKNDGVLYIRMSKKNNNSY